MLSVSETRDERSSSSTRLNIQLGPIMKIYDIIAQKPINEAWFPNAAEAKAMSKLLTAWLRDIKFNRPPNMDPEYLEKIVGKELANSQEFLQKAEEKLEKAVDKMRKSWGSMRDKLFGQTLGSVDAELSSRYDKLTKLAGAYFIFGEPWIRFVKQQYAIDHRKATDNSYTDAQWKADRTANMGHFITAVAGGMALSSAAKAGTGLIKILGGVVTWIPKVGPVINDALQVLGDAGRMYLVQQLTAKDNSVLAGLMAGGTLDFYAGAVGVMASEAAGSYVDEWYNKFMALINHAKEVDKHQNKPADTAPVQANPSANSQISATSSANAPADQPAASKTTTPGDVIPTVGERGW